MDKVRFLVIGVGGMGRAHIEQLTRIPEVEIVALADPAEAAHAAVKKQFPELADVPTFTDYGRALKEVPADAAVIVSPHSQHLEQGLACLDAGLHVLMEKPFVAGSANAERLIAAAKARGKHLAVSYQRHVQGPYLFLRELVNGASCGFAHHTVSDGLLEFRSNSGISESLHQCRKRVHELLHEVLDAFGSPA